MRGDGKGVAKGETQRGEKSAHHAVRHGVLFSLMGSPPKPTSLPFADSEISHNINLVTKKAELRSAKF